MAKTNIYILSILLLAFLLRFFPLSFPNINLTASAHLPVTSFLTDLGILIFGNNDLGKSILFIILGTLTVYLIMLISEIISKDTKIKLLAGVIAAISPALIFISRTPNEFVVAAFLYCLLFYLLTRKNLQIFLILLVSLVLILTTTFSWLSLPIYIFITLHFFRETTLKDKLIYSLGSLGIIFLVLAYFLQSPDIISSLRANNLSLFDDIGIKNGLDKSRGQGYYMGWNGVFERLLFNKSYFLIVGVLNWLSQISPANYFGIFDQNGGVNIVRGGLLFKVLIIPAFLGLWISIKSKVKLKYLLLLLFTITFPLTFIYPSKNLGILTTATPFLILLVSYGLLYLNKKILGLVLTLAVIELLMVLF